MPPGSEPRILFGNKRKSSLRTLLVYGTIAALLALGAVSSPGRVLMNMLLIGVRDMAEAYLPKAAPPPRHRSGVSSARLSAPVEPGRGRGEVGRTVRVAPEARRLADEVSGGAASAGEVQEVRQNLEAPTLLHDEGIAFSSTPMGRGLIITAIILAFFLIMGALLFRNRDNQGRGFF